MDQWLFDKEDFSDTPSVRWNRDIPRAAGPRERMQFHISSRFEIKLCYRPQVVLATATTFFHRFYMRYSMKEYHIYDIGATCLFLSTKVEENTRKLRDIVNACAQKAQKNEKLQLSEDSKVVSECIAAGALLLADQYLSEELPSEAWARIGVDLEEAHEVAAAIVDYLIVNQPRRHQLSNGNKPPSEYRPNSEYKPNPSNPSTPNYASQEALYGFTNQSPDS
ncbi:unnamed protein product [Umbelopsis vinacea]